MNEFSITKRMKINVVVLNYYNDSI